MNLSGPVVVLVGQKEIENGQNDIICKGGVCLEENRAHKEPLS